MNKLEKSCLLAFFAGAIGTAAFTGIAMNANGGPLPTLRETQEQYRTLSENYDRLRQKHERFVSQMPNYNDFGHWAEGDRYENWMIEDINTNYKSSSLCSNADELK